jgi:hypothetical protein
MESKRLSELRRQKPWELPSATDGTHMASRFRGFGSMLNHIQLNGLCPVACL